MVYSKGGLESELGVPAGPAWPHSGSAEAAHETGATAPEVVGRLLIPSP